MNKSILIAGTLIAAALLLQPVIKQLTEKQTITICTEKGALKICSERDALKLNPLYGVFEDEERSDLRFQIEAIHTPNEYQRQFQDMSREQKSEFHEEQKLKRQNACGNAPEWDGKGERNTPERKKWKKCMESIWQDQFTFVKPAEVMQFSIDINPSHVHASSYPPVRRESVIAVHFTA